MFCISVSYQKTPLAVRERFAFLPKEQEAFLDRLDRIEHIPGAVAVSTCNRCEIYASGTREQFERVISVLAEVKRIGEDDIKRYGFFYGEDQAVRHLFRVCAGLDSMVLGEDEILRQVREAYGMASRNGHTDGELNILFQGAFHGAKQAKTRTALSTTPLSIGTLTANEIERYLTAEGCTRKENGQALVIGATGKIGSIVAGDLLAKGISVIGTSRNYHGRTTVIMPYQEQIKWIDFKERYRYMEQADAVVSATVSPHYTVTKQEYREAVGTNRRRLMVDLAVPGDIDRELTKLPGITFLDIDYFKKAAKENQDVRLGEMEKAERILADCAEDALKKLYLWRFREKFDGRGEEWFSKMVFYLKDVLDSGQFRQVLDRIYAAETGEKV